MKTLSKKQLLVTTLLSGATFGAAAAPSFAQSADEIVVTGTRVERQNLEAPSPVTAIDSEELTLTNTINTEQFINSLPQLVPAFDGTSNNPGTGTATANLRGLGSNRTLVLVDGNRYVSAFGDGVVDLNSIPSALVKRVDIVTGGASAVYGSDAMAGVVNFILDDEFEGFEVEASYQSSEKGDAGIKNISATMGGNFDNGRGNATVFLGYSQRDEVFQGARDFSSLTNSDTGSGFSPFGSSGVPGTRLFAGFDFTNAGYTTDGTTCTPPPGGSAEGLSGTCTGGATFAQDGTIIPWINGGANTTRYNYAPVNYLQLPQERYSMAAFASYDITDSVTAKIRGIFTSNNVPQELAPTPFFSTVTIDTVNNPFLTPESRATIEAANGGPGLFPVFIGRRMLEINERNSDQELDSYQLSGDLSGRWSDDWDWDLHAHISRTNGVQVQTGNVSISAMQNAVLTNQCNIFGSGNFSQACVDIVARTGTIQNTTEQRNIVATSDGPVSAIQSPGAENPLQIVLGAEYRQENYDLRPDSVLGPDVAGFNQSLPVSGEYNSYELFGEAYMPLVEGATWAEELSLNGAYRYSDYSTVGGVSSYAIGAEWAPVSDIRFRGQFQRAVRAPNVVELFSPFTNGFPGADDPCAASPGRGVATGVQAICEANGVPMGSFGLSSLQPNSQIEGLFGGNANLFEETSDTITLGFVAQPSAVPGLTLTVDYYDIEIQNAIGVKRVQGILDGCYGGANPEFCSLITRTGSGQIDNIRLQTENLALFTAEGIDAQLDYNFDAEDIGLAMIGGEFGLQIIGGYSLERGNKNDDATPFFDCAGFFGARGTAGCGEPNPEWKHTATLRHTTGPLLNSLRWRYIGGTEDDDPLSDDLTLQFGFSPATLFADSIKAENYFDFTSQWDISDHFQISGGIINIFDNDPPVLGDCCSEQANTYPATYNPFGRQFFVSGKMRF